MTLLVANVLGAPDDVGCPTTEEEVTAMSDVSQGLSWWQASDGKWYPPEQARATPCHHPLHLRLDNRLTWQYATSRRCSPPSGRCSGERMYLVEVGDYDHRVTYSDHDNVRRADYDLSCQRRRFDANRERRCTVKLIAYGPDPGNGIFKPPAGSSLVSATVEGCATSKSASFNPLYFKLKMADNTTSNAALGEIDGQIDSSEQPRHAFEARSDSMCRRELRQRH